MTASPAARETEDYDNVATQWFVVSDLGLATMSGKDGLHVACARSPPPTPVADAKVRLIARNNEVLGEGKARRQRATCCSTPACMKGEGGAAPALVVAQSADGDYSFVDLHQPAFDLTDRGVDGPRAVGRGRCLRLCRARRLPPRRDGARHRAAARRQGQGHDRPAVTLVVERPDGVDYLTRPSMTGRGRLSHDFTDRPGAQGGTWRIKALTDPDGDAVGETSFLVEDYIPDRIEFDLKSKTPRVKGDGLQTHRRRPLSVRRARRRPRPRGQRQHPADDTPFPEWKDYNFGLMDEQPDPIQVTAAGLPQTDINGHADIDIALPELPVTTQPLKADVSVRMREPGGRAVERTASLPIDAAQPLLGIMAEFRRWLRARRPGRQPSRSSPSIPRASSKRGEGRQLDAEAPRARLAVVQHRRPVAVGVGHPHLEDRQRHARHRRRRSPPTSRRPCPGANTVSRSTRRASRPPPSISHRATYTDNSAKADTPDTLKVGARQDRREDRRHHQRQDRCALCRQGHGADRRREAAGLQEVDVPEGGITLPFTVGEGWGTGAYVLASLYKPMDVKAKRMPSRAMGACLVRHRPRRAHPRCRARRRPS